jgi:AcrR family transcriptional regulator
MSTRTVNPPAPSAADKPSADMPRPVRRTERGEQRRQALVEAALAVFLEQGYERASIEEVMRRVGGGSKASLYSYFGSKEGLFWEVLSLQCDRFMQDLRVPTLADDHLEETLAAVARRFLKQISEPVSRSLFRIMIAEAPRFPELAERFYERGAASVRRMLGHYLEQQCEAGRLRCDDVELAAIHFFELLKAPHLRMMLGLSPFPRGMSMEKYVSQSVRLFLYGCAVREPERRR